MNSPRGSSAEPAFHRPSAHLRQRDLWAGQESVGVGWVNPDEQATVSRRAHRHVAAQQEREAAEHLPLADSILFGEQPAQPVCQILVVGHRRLSRLVPGRSSQPRNDSITGMKAV